jgi:hypothetical protein
MVVFSLVSIAELRNEQNFYNGNWLLRVGTGSALSPASLPVARLPMYPVGTGAARYVVMGIHLMRRYSGYFSIDATSRSNGAWLTRISPRVG